MIKHGQIPALGAWLEAIPLEEREARPALLSLLGVVRSARDDFQSGLSLQSQALAMEEAQTVSELAARIRLRRAADLLSLGRATEALKDADDVLDLAVNGLDQPTLLAEALWLKGTILLEQGKAVLATPWLEDSLQRFEKLQDAPLIARAQMNLGVALERQNRYTEARRYYELSLDHLLQVGNLVQASTSLNNLAVLCTSTGDYEQAERQGRRSVALEPRDGWGWHAVAHAMEMRNRAGDGVDWLRPNADHWSPGSFLAVHNWWHLALFELELEHVDEALRLFDGPIHGARSTVVLDMIDASSMLWRLYLRGVELGDRWQTVADGWAPIAGAGNYAFNDLHAMMAFVGSGRRNAQEQVLEAQRAALESDGDNAAFTREVGMPACLAFRAFGDGDYAESVRLLRSIRGNAQRFGGSHAQRDVIELTLSEAALRTGDTALATALANERLAMRPRSPLARLLVQRAARMGERGSGIGSDRVARTAA